MEETSIEQNIPASFKMMRNFFNWSYENPDVVNPNVTAIYVFILDHHSRLGFKEKFGLPTMMTMEAVGIKNYRTYKKALDILVDFGFINIVEWSRNQYSSNIIALVKNTKANTKALTKASTKHIQKHSESTASIDKLKNLRTKEDIDTNFEIIWSNYGKVGSKQKAFEIWKKMDDEKQDKIAKSISGYLNHLQKTGYSPKHFTTYLNSDEYENYLNISTSAGGEVKVEVIKVLPNFANGFNFSLWGKIPKGTVTAERWQWYRENRAECSEVYQHCQKLRDRDQEEYLKLGDSHPLMKFIKDYIQFVTNENNQ